MTKNQDSSSSSYLEGKNLAVTTKGGEEVVPCVTPNHYKAIRTILRQDCLITDSHIIAQAAFCEAMVVRSGLGLTSRNATVHGIIAPSIEGAIVAATLRHLHHGGCDVSVTILENNSEIPEFLTEIAPLVPLEIILNAKNATNPPNVFSDGFNLNPLWQAILIGVPLEYTFPLQVSSVINDSPVAVHSIGISYGVNPLDGTTSGDALCSATTLALGLPLTGNILAPNWTGRLYVADISIPQPLVQQFGYKIGQPFSEQPVQQLIW
jgi:hypothetical protein